MKPLYVYGQWEIDLNRRELRSAGAAVPMGGKAFDILAVLVSSAGTLVTKDALMEAVWPGSIVEDNTIQVHISAFRKALGPDRKLLQTASGRGYRLLGEWVAKPDTAIPPAAIPPTAIQAGSPEPQRRGNMPGPGSELIGRALAVQHLRDLLSAYRAVTLTGPGGIGKTSLAQAVAHSVLATSMDEVWLVELASLNDPALVPSAVAAALGVELRGAAISRDAVARAIGGRTLLLVLDNCEHVIDEAARLAETLLRTCPGVTLLATSREALGIDGEYAYRTAPLVVPPSEAVDLAGSSAVRLFLDRARARGMDMPADRMTLRAIAAICRRLDGIPLAIEFAAARAATLGIDQLLVRLDDRFALLTAGRRTALPRHQTLRATLDWSHDLLPGPERVLLRRLSVFAGGFTLQAAAAVAGLPIPAAVDGIASLVAKSLLGLEDAATVSRWRLLETTRAYAQQKLLEADEAAATARRHAAYFSDLLAPAGPRDTVRGDERDIDSIRLALDWAFSPDGDPGIGVALTIGAVPLWVRLSLVAECRGRVERALASLGRDIDDAPHARMHLNAALGWALMFDVGRASATHAAWSATLALAEQLGDASHRLRALWGLWVDSLNNGAFLKAAELAEAFAGLVSDSSDMIDQMMADRMMATSLHYLGDQSNARRLIERMLGRPETPAPDPQVLRFQFDQRVTAHYFQARIMWLQGFADQARRVVEANLLAAEATRNALSLASVLGQGACLVALFSGDLAAAEGYGARLLDHAARHRLGLWEGWARGFNAAVRIRQGDIEGGLAGLRAELSVAAEARFLPRYLVLIGELAVGLGMSGETELGLQTADEAIARCEANGELWFLAELLRIRSELVRQNGAGEANAEALLRQALVCADGQGALAWSLRAAISLVLLRPDPAAVDQLQAVYGRFSEGFDTADLLTARRILDQLS
jgi:predicted ATPase/DNA-binding winged helix-turn-helix (wHTH) protein